LTIFLIIVFPALSVNFGDYSSDAFKFWIITVLIYNFIYNKFIFIGPIITKFLLKAQIFVVISFAYSLLSPFVENLILRVVGRVIKERRERMAQLELLRKEEMMRKMALKKSKVSVKQEEPEPEEQDVNEMDLQYDD
jgi:hypothetical protein